MTRGSTKNASGIDAWVSGGIENTAITKRASASGGYANKASGEYASVSGGLSNEAGASV